MELTKKENEFLKYLKRDLRFKGVKIKEKISIKELCEERPELDFVFGNDKNIVKDITIDFVLYKGLKAVAGIELIDEPDELELEKGKNMLIDTLFKALGYELFRIVDLNQLEKASKIIVDKIYR